MNKEMNCRIVMTIFGIFFSGVAVGMFKFAAFGVDPFQTFMSGMNALIPISFGNLYVIVNGALLLFALIFDRHYIGLGTVLNLLLLGYVVEFVQNTLESALSECDLLVRLVILFMAIIILCMSSSLYFVGNLGVSTYDAIALVMANKWQVATFKFCRIGCDLVCVTMGCVLFLLSGGTVKELPMMIGIGTIITAFFMGPLIEFFNVHLSKPVLDKMDIS